ncbi:MAG: hypothetical protein KKE11_03220 [Gammaproteobacteria bacterium]|nr:hypothetical protein [Gammaproteobacteria bacterium]
MNDTAVILNDIELACIVGGYGARGFLTNELFYITVGMVVFAYYSGSIISYFSKNDIVREKKEQEEIDNAIGKVCFLKAEELCKFSCEKS